MNLKILFAFIVYWSLSFLILGVGSTLASDSYGNPLVDGGYSSTGSFNTTGWNQTEIDDDTGGIWGFFSGIAGVFTSMFRISGMIFFGVTDALTGLPGVLFTFWQSAITVLFIGFIISSFWDG